MRAGRTIAGDQPGAVAIGKHRAPEPAGALEQPFGPDLVLANRAVGVGQQRAGHLVDQLLLVLEVPVEGRALHPEDVGQPPRGQAVQARLVQQLQRRTHDHRALQAHQMTNLS